MRISRSLFLPLLLIACTATAQVPSKKDVLSAVLIMQDNYTRPEAAAAAEIITTFADQSHEVAVPVSPENLPWLVENWELDDAHDEAVRTMILAAYIGGIVRQQLEDGKASNNPYEGWIAAIHAYRQFQEKLKFTSPSLEKFSKLEEADKLKSVAAERAAKTPERPAPTPPAALRRTDSSRP